MKRIRDLSKQQLVELVTSIRAELFQLEVRPGDMRNDLPVGTVYLDPDKEWGSDTAEAIWDHFINFGIAPNEDDDDDVAIVHDPGETRNQP